MTTLFVIQFLVMLWVAGLTLGGCLLGQHVRTTRRAVLAAFRGAPNALRLPPHPPAPVAAAVDRGPADGPDDLVVPPPTVRGDSVRDWLMYHTRHEHCWSDAVAAFYRRAAADPQIAAYFVGVDVDRLRRHFTAVMVLVTSTGLTGRAMRAMALAHAEVRSAAGVPITAAVYDRTVDLLVAVLAELGVPGQALAELGAVIGPLRAVVVAA